MTRDGIERLLGIPETAWIVQRVRQRVLDAGGEPMVGIVRLDDPTDAQRAAAVRLVGRPRRQARALSIDLAVVEQILRRGPWPAGLADAVQELTGAVVDRGAERQRERDAWSAVMEVLAAEVVGSPGLVSWWTSWCAAGGLKRAARAEATRSGIAPLDAGAALVHGVVAILRSLPVAGEPLAMLARRTVGDAHGLDASRPLGRLAVAVVWAAFGSGGPRPSSREAWGSAGVERSALASTALCLGVAGRAEPETAGGRATAAALEAMRLARMPVILTLDQVRSEGVRALTPERVVHVCENPTVVEVAADRWSRTDVDRHPVLVCTSGQPSIAVIELLGQLTADGAECRYHGDFDWAGLRIAAALAARVPWTPWRFEADDYRAAAAGIGDGSLELTGTPAAAPWDPALAVAMVEIGYAVEEEAVAELLVADLLT